VAFLHFAVQRLAKKDVFNLFWGDMMLLREFINNVRQPNNIGNMYENPVAAS
jgi:hypothetical protein